MVVELVALAFDADAPAELAQFWARALRWDLRSGSSGEPELVPTDATSFRLQFHRGAAAKVVLADPEGNELCVIEPGNRFLSSCPRLGAVNCDGTRALGQFYRAALGWPLVWDQDEETAIQSPAGVGPKITWSGPPLLPKSARERIHFHVEPVAGASVEAALEHLLRLGARRNDDGHDCVDAIRLADVDGNELCVVERTAAV